MHEPLFRSLGDINADLFFVYFIGLMESNPSEEGSCRPVEEEEMGSNAPIHSQGRDRREESSWGTVGRTQQAFLE